MNRRSLHLTCSVSYMPCHACWGRPLAAKPSMARAWQNRADAKSPVDRASADCRADWRLGGLEGRAVQDLVGDVGISARRACSGISPRAKGCLRPNGQTACVVGKAKVDAYEKLTEDFLGMRRAACSRGQDTILASSKMRRHARRDRGGRRKRGGRGTEASMMEMDGRDHDVCAPGLLLAKGLWGLTSLGGRGSGRPLIETEAWQCTLETSRG